MRYFSSLLITLFLCSGSDAQQPDEAEEKKRRLSWMVQSAGEVKMSLGDESKLTVKKEPLLRWSNPVSGVDDGTVFIWTHENRPHVAAQLFRVPDGTWLHEFQSLSQQPILAKLQGRTLWSPRRPGIKMMPIPDVPKPAATSTAVTPRCIAMTPGSSRSPMSDSPR